MAVRASIIIPTLNRCALLRKTLSSLVLQTLAADQFEIIVVDNGSTDDTCGAVQSIIADHPDRRIRYVFEPEPGLLSGRHRGAREAEADLLIFIDDDIEAVRDWLAAIIGAFDDLQVQLVGGRNLPKYQHSPPKWIEQFWEDAPNGGRYCFYLSLLDLGAQRRIIPPTLIFGLNFAIRRQALLDLGGFHPECLSGDLQEYDGDGEYGLTMKAEDRDFLALYEPAATVYHFVPSDRMTLEYFKRRSYVEGIHDSYTDIRRNGLPTRWRRMRRAVGRAVRRMISSPADKIARDIADSRQIGFNFHRRAIRSNPKLLDWVRRPDYWNYRLPR